LLANGATQAQAFVPEPVHPPDVGSSTTVEERALRLQRLFSVACQGMYGA
jgi:hypothetical protein